jgi:hypothetical protein
MEKCIDMMMA